MKREEKSKEGKDRTGQEKQEKKRKERQTHKETEWYKQKEPYYETTKISYYPSFPRHQRLELKMCWTLHLPVSVQSPSSPPLGHRSGNPRLGAANTGLFEGKRNKSSWEGWRTRIRRGFLTRRPEDAKHVVFWKKTHLPKHDPCPLVYLPVLRVLGVLLLGSM